MYTVQNYQLKNKIKISPKASCVSREHFARNFKKEFKNISEIIKLSTTTTIAENLLLLIADIPLDTNNLKRSDTMASLPQAAYVTCKLREQYREQDYILSRLKTCGTDKNDIKNFNDNQKQKEYTPVKYNGKLMNSIWGLYNRYSPHNVKKNEYAPPK